MNYRTFYEKETSLSLPPDFDVHHIDLNRENNQIKNLVAIPKPLHCEYHRLSANREIIIKELLDVHSLINQNAFFEEMALMEALDFVRVKKKCFMFICFKEKLLGNHIAMQVCKHNTYEQVKRAIKNYG